MSNNIAHAGRKYYFRIYSTRRDVTYFGSGKYVSVQFLLQRVGSKLTSRIFRSMPEVRLKFRAAAEVKF